MGRGGRGGDAGLRRGCSSRERRWRTAGRTGSGQGSGDEEEWRQDGPWGVESSDLNLIRSVTETEMNGAGFFICEKDLPVCDKCIKNYLYGVLYFSIKKIYSLCFKI
jgi:hypothetical protein